MHPLKLIFMGTPEFALPTLAALLVAGHEIAAVYTTPPRPAGRGQKETLTPIHRFGLEHHLNVLAPATLRDAATQQHFKAFGADAAVVAAYGLLLPQAILEGTRMGCINVHPSLLPRWRGAAPIQRTIMAGDTETGVVIMQMNAGLDTGDMLMIKRHAIPDGTAAGELHDTLAQMAGPMVVETLAGLADGSVTPVAQPEDGVTYAAKITKAESRIDWRESGVKIRQKILGLNPYPGASFSYKGEIIKILKADLILRQGEPGAILSDDLIIACGQDALLPTLVQRPGKKPLPAAEMQKGLHVPIGTVLD